MSMKKVRAKLIGYHGDEIRNEGDEFLIPADEKLGSWMELVEPAPKAKPAAKPGGKKKGEQDGEQNGEQDDDNPFA